ncbi:hypothetical protein OAL55_01485 [Verrucomicrobiales bacterium]|nr:hypothetical protein [Verrucomicrobiales bacterium]
MGRITSMFSFRILFSALLGLLFMIAAHQPICGQDVPVEQIETLPAVPVDEEPESGGVIEDGQPVPEPLQPWIPWVSKGIHDEAIPRHHGNGMDRLPLWISRATIDAQPKGADFSVEVEAFDKTWLSLPGGGRQWPSQVAVDGVLTPVVDRADSPTICLSKGKSTITGKFEWNELPQKISIPPQIGLLDLQVGGVKKPAPSRDADGTLWLQREASTEAVDEDFLSIKVHSLLEDGIPLWFETRIDLIVAGKSREEALGAVLPQGWQLATITSPIPVAIDEKGFLKAQLRAGRWSIVLRAFQNAEVDEIRFAEDAKPAAEDQALAYGASPEFRQAEIMGLPQIDVAQTQMPEEWRSFPIYRWDTSGAFQLVERVRGPGVRGKAPLTIRRLLWLDDDGKMLTYHDSLSGELRQIRRLDAADSHQLGSVSVNGEPQLITHNPDGGDRGFEIRTPRLDAVATGRIEMQDSLSATGWQTDAGSLTAHMQLSPGYRLFALMGADYTKGDWLTSWTLLDLFLLLLFTLAVFRLRGFLGALLALVAFGLAYHEPGAPKLPWLLLLVPVALCEVNLSERWRKWNVIVKWGAAVILLMFLAPFLAYQIQGAIFPQLERKAAYNQPAASGGYAPSVQRVASQVVQQSSSRGASKKPTYSKSKENLKADPKAVIQTGPGVPMWTWRTIEFGFDGPVSASQTVKPILISPIQSRIIGVVRVLALVLLAVLLFRRRKKKSGSSDSESEPTSKGLPSGVTSSAAMVIGAFILVAAPSNASAQFPEAEMLKELRNRLSETPPGFPDAASVASASMTIEEEAVTLELEFHAVARAAVPIPVPMNAMEPVSASFASGEPATLLRDEGKLWILLPEPGIHRIVVKGILRNRSDWEWGFDLKPRKLTVEASGWTVSGIRTDGSAEDQVLFSKMREEGSQASSANYDDPRTNHAILVSRQIELGLVWRVQTTVSRLSPKGRAVALNVPLLEGEKVVSAGRTVKGGAIEARLGPGTDSVSWEGELTPDTEFSLQTPKDATWTERWRLLASSVWNVSFNGLSPVFESADDQLIPLWQPWPGESATVLVSRPEAVEGAAVTIDSAKHTMRPGKRQRSSALELQVRTSLGEDFPIQIPAGSEVSSLIHDGKNIPIRKEGDAVVVPLRPGPQSIKVEWRGPNTPEGWTRADSVKLPVETANVTSLIRPSRDRWLIVTDGPLRGPAVRFWAVLVFALLAAVVLSRIPGSPLRFHTWLLLLIGLTQIHIAGSLFIIGWLFFALWKDKGFWKRLSPLKHNFLQIGLIGLTIIIVGLFIVIASAGLLGNPEMYVAGVGSSATYLNWFSARAPVDLPTPGYWSISIWWFRLAMLLWALWLAYSLVRWLRDGWKNSAERGHFKSGKKQKDSLPPELPKRDS